LSSGGENRAGIAAVKENWEGEVISSIVCDSERVGDEEQLTGGLENSVASDSESLEEVDLVGNGEVASQRGTAGGVRNLEIDWTSRDRPLSDKTECGEKNSEGRISDGCNRVGAGVEIGDENETSCSSDRVGCECDRSVTESEGTRVDENVVDDRVGFERWGEIDGQWISNSDNSSESD
jgi:hypothetical protein